MDKKSLTITLDIYSGRKNPQAVLTGESLEFVLEILNNLEKTPGEPKIFPPIPTLGYRGIEIEQVDLLIPGLPRTFKISASRLFTGDTTYKIPIDTIETDLIEKFDLEIPLSTFAVEIQTLKERYDFWKLWKEGVLQFEPVVCKCAPPYEPIWWNQNHIQAHNNCYNYACNYRTDSYAQPGLASGAATYTWQCNTVKAAAVADNLEDSPGANNDCPDEGHLVALVIWPNHDYHWYRKGRNGKWTHKMANKPATNLDNSGNIIDDPRTADRGAYSDFCTFMLVKQGHIKIK